MRLKAFFLQRIPIFFPLLLFLQCAPTKSFYSLDNYDEKNPHPVVFGSLSGIPANYFMTLNFVHRAPDGIKQFAAWPVGPPKPGEDRTGRSFSNVVKRGQWTLIGFELTTYDQLATEDPSVESKTLVVRFLTLDSLKVRFEAEHKTLHYLGQWKFSGLENFKDIFLPELINYNSQNDSRDRVTQPKARFGLTMENKEELDRVQFYRKNEKLATRQNKTTLPTMDPIPVLFRMELTVSSL